MRNRFTSLGTVAVLGIAVVLAFILGAGLNRLNPFRSEPFVNQGPVVLEGVRELSTLTSVEFVEYTTVEKGVDRGLLDWATGESIVVFALARIGAGVDLAGLSEGSVEVDDEANSVSLYLPRATIQYVAVDSEATQVLDRDTGLFTSGSKDLETEARQVAEQSLRDKALEAGILETAEANARTALDAFLRSLGFETIEIAFAGDPGS